MVTDAPITIDKCFDLTLSCIKGGTDALIAIHEGISSLDDAQFLDFAYLCMLKWIKVHPRVASQMALMFDCIGIKDATASELEYLWEKRCCGSLTTDEDRLQYAFFACFAASCFTDLPFAQTITGSKDCYARHIYEKPQFVSLTENQGFIAGVYSFPVDAFIETPYGRKFQEFCKNEFNERTATVRTKGFMKRCIEEDIVYPLISYYPDTTNEPPETRTVPYFASVMYTMFDQFNNDGTRENSVTFGSCLCVVDDDMESCSRKRKKDK